MLVILFLYSSETGRDGLTQYSYFRLRLTKLSKLLFPISLCLILFAIIKFYSIIFAPVVSEPIKTFDRLIRVNVLKSKYIVSLYV